MHFDALSHQQVGKPRQPGAIPHWRKHVFGDHAAVPARDAIPAMLQERTLRRHLAVRQCFQRRHRRHEVTTHAIAVTQQAFIGTSVNQTARARHLKRHSDAAMRHRPAIAIARIERVVGLAGEVVEAEAIEPACVILAVTLQPSALPLGDLAIDRLCRRREVVSRVAAHFVQVDIDQRPPFQERGDARSGLGLSHAEPIAVHVEHRVIGAATRPRLAVLGGLRSRIRKATACATRVEHETIATIGVLQRIDQHHTFVEHLRYDVIVGRREQVVEHIECCIGARRLITVHTVCEPPHRRQVPQQSFACRFT